MAIVSCRRDENENFADRIITMERAALDRWGKGDVNGFLEIDAPDITYFDPAVEKRVDGLGAMSKYLTPFAGKIEISRYEMIDPKVQQYGEVAVLTYNLLDAVVKAPDGLAKIEIRWNCTEVYARSEAVWRIVHTHWSYTKPDLKKPE